MVKPAVCKREMSSTSPRLSSVVRPKNSLSCQCTRWCAIFRLSCIHPFRSILYPTTLLRSLLSSISPQSTGRSSITLTSPPSLPFLPNPPLFRASSALLWSVRLQLPFPTHLSPPNDRTFHPPLLLPSHIDPPLNSSDLHSIHPIGRPLHSLPIRLRPALRFRLFLLPRRSARHHSIRPLQTRRVRSQMHRWREIPLFPGPRGYR